MTVESQVADTQPRGRILVIDDDRDFAESLQNLLVLEGYDVATAHAMGQALDVVERFDAQVAILDYRLAHDVTGLDLVAPLKQRRPELICILSTAYADMGSAVGALRAGIYDYFGKPLRTEQFLATLGRCFEKLRLEEEKRAAEEALREAKKTEAVAQIAGGVAHHFNNLLQIMQGNLELLAEHVPDDTVQSKQVATVMRAIERAAEINQSLVGYAHHQMLNPGPIDVTALVSEAEHELRREFPGSIRIDTVTPPDLWPVWADRTQLKASIVCLARNAAEAMPDAGTLTIATANEEMQAAGAAPNGRPHAGEYVVLEVADTGRGMPQEIAERAFEPFFSGHGLAGKVGLGLSTVYGFAKQSAGQVSIHSEEGRGTTVRLYLPAADSARR
jgi:signal transduction histidine kinase